MGSEEDDHYVPRRRSSTLECPAGVLEVDSLNSGDVESVAGTSNLSLSPSRDCKDFLKTGVREVWLFGYGSVIWKPGFDYAVKVDGYIKGFRRVFHQGSTDHRGTPSQPGRTATLESAADCVTWGTAFRLAGTFEQQLEALQYLEWREKQYDLRMHLDVYGPTSSTKPVICNALTYIASPNRGANANWLGYAPLETMARQIALARGPSGPNCEYVFCLAQAMLSMGVDDAELQALAQQVRWHLNTPEAKAAMQRRIEAVPITCKYARACMERHQSAGNLFAARDQVANWSDFQI